MKLAIQMTVFVSVSEHLNIIDIEFIKSDFSLKVL